MNVQLYSHKASLRFESHVVQEINEVFDVMLLFFVDFESVWNIVEVGSREGADVASVLDVVVQSMALFSQRFKVFDDDTEHDVDRDDVDADIIGDIVHPPEVVVRLLVVFVRHSLHDVSHTPC